MSFVKATSATAELVVEASTVPQVVEAVSNHQEGQTAQGALALAQDPWPDVVVEVPNPQQDFRSDVVEESPVSQARGTESLPETEGVTRIEVAEEKKKKESSLGEGFFWIQDCIQKAEVCRIKNVKT